MYVDNVNADRIIGL